MQFKILWIQFVKNGADNWKKPLRCGVVELNDAAEHGVSTTGCDLLADVDGVAVAGAGDSRCCSGTPQFPVTASIKTEI